MILLDNGAFEKGVAMGDEEYLEWISKLQPQRVVLPDDIHDVRNSTERGLTFLNKAEASLGELFYKIDWMAVLHGQDIEALNYEYAFYSQNGAISFGIPYMHWKSVYQRATIARLIPRVKVFNIHYLGLKNTDEIGLAPPCVYSLDTSFPWKRAQEKKRLDWEMEMSDFQVELAVRLMERLRKHCKKTESVKYLNV